jgi:CRP-like cAMP-binding protein
LKEDYSSRATGATPAPVCGTDPIPAAFRTAHRDSAIKSAKAKRPFLRAEQAGGRYDQWANPRTNVEVWAALASIPDKEIREIVQKTLPRNPVEYRRGLHLLARHLRTLDPNAPADSWHPVVGVWFHLARPLGKAYRREWVYARFEQSYLETVARPGEAIRQAVQPAGTGLGCDVAKVFRLMVSFLGTRTVYLSARKLAEWVGVSVATAARRLKALVASGGVRVVSQGVPHVYDRDATVYDASPMYALCDRAALPDAPGTISISTWRSERLAKPVSDAKWEKADAGEEACLQLLCLTDTDHEPDSEDDAFRRAFEDEEREENPDPADCPPTCPGCNWCQFWGRDG